MMSLGLMHISQLGGNAINPADVLPRVAALPITKWQFKVSPGHEHLGPKAQDVHPDFNLDTDDKQHPTTGNLFSRLSNP